MNMEIAIERLKKIPFLERTHHIERIGNELGLTREEMRVCFWKAEGWTDEQIAQEKVRLKSESKDKALLDFMSDISTRNPEGNVPLGNPKSNVASIARVAQLRKNGKTLQEAFTETFGEAKYEAVIEHTQHES